MKCIKEYHSAYADLSRQLIYIEDVILQTDSENVISSLRASILSLKCSLEAKKALVKSLVLKRNKLNLYIKYFDHIGLDIIERSGIEAVQK